MQSDNQKTIRLNKHLALAMGISRRAADDLISKGRIQINGKPADLGARIDASDELSIDGKAIIAQHEYEYIALNKPVGYVCSRRRQGANPTIYELIPKQYEHLKPVGRLDKDSSGLILLTNDGDFAQQMTHPKYVKTKIYEVRLDKPLQPLHQQMIVDFGVNLDDGKSQFVIERVDNSNDEYRITMTEGRNRQIRRTFNALGYRVKALHRTNFGKYSIGDLKPGQIESISA